MVTLTGAGDRYRQLLADRLGDRRQPPPPTAEFDEMDEEEEEVEVDGFGDRGAGGAGGADLEQLAEEIIEFEEFEEELPVPHSYKLLIGGKLVCS